MSQDLDRELVQVEALLTRAAANFAYPATPPLAAAVRARLVERPSRSDGRQSVSAWWLRPAGAAAALIAAAIVSLGVTLSIPQSRSALADFFHLSHVRVVHELAGSPTPPVLVPGNFARPSGIAALQNVADFPLLLPTQDGERIAPDAVYAQGEASKLPTAIFVYEDYDLYETRLGYFGKAAVDPNLIHSISFGGQPAYWIDQGGHMAEFLDEQGHVVAQSQRSVDRATLLWERNGVTYRLETSLSQEQAIQVAESLR
jgi:hypothetical protein